MDEAIKHLVRCQSKSDDTVDEKCRSFFGTPRIVIQEVWKRIEPSVDETSAKPMHLLWSLVFLHVYSTEEIHCRIVGDVDPNNHASLLPKNYVELLYIQLSICEDLLKTW